MKCEGFTGALSLSGSPCSERPDKGFFDVDPWFTNRLLLKGLRARIPMMLRGAGAGLTDQESTLRNLVQVPKDG